MIVTGLRARAFMWREGLAASHKEPCPNGEEDVGGAYQDIGHLVRASRRRPRQGYERAPRGEDCKNNRFHGHGSASQPGPSLRVIASRDGMAGPNLSPRRMCQ